MWALGCPCGSPPISLETYEIFLNYPCLIVMGSDLPSILEPYVSNTDVYTFVGILNAFKLYVENNNCIDPQNSSMIICNEHLVKVLYVKALHISQVKRYISQHLQFHSRWTKPEINRMTHRYTCKTRDRKYLTSLDSERNNPTLFEISHNFRNILETMPFFPDHLVKFTFNQVFILLLRYIDVFREVLRDPNNKNVVITKNHELGNVLNVDAFHIKQLVPIIKKLLTH